jgi:hypothetical protein
MIIGITLSDYKVAQFLEEINMENCTKYTSCFCAKHRNSHSEDKKRLTAEKLYDMLIVLGALTSRLFYALKCHPE